MNNNSFLSGGIIGFLVFAGIIYLLIKTKILLWLLIGVVVIIIIAVLVYNIKKNKHKKQLNEANKTNDEFAKIIKANRQKIRGLRANIFKIEDEQVKENVDEMSKTAKWIIDNLEQNPNDYNASRRFLNYYLGSAAIVVEKYVQFEKGEGYTSEQADSLEKSKKTIDIINKYFKKQKTKLLDNDFLDMKVEMEVLEKALKIEGMFEEED